MTSNQAQYMFENPANGQREYRGSFAIAKQDARNASHLHNNVHVDIYRQTTSGNYSFVLTVWGSQIPR